jgi:hypothetical protein
MITFNYNTGEVSGTPEEVSDFTLAVQLMDTNEEYKREKLQIAFKKAELEHKKLELEMYRVIEDLGKYIISEETDGESEGD